MHRVSAAVPVEPGLRLFPDEPLDAAMRLLASQERIQVVSRLNHNEVLGTLTLDDVHRAYGLPNPEGSAEDTAEQKGPTEAEVAR